MSDLDELLLLQEEVFAVLERPDLLRRNTVEMLAGCLAEPHHSLGAFAGGRLAGVGILYDPLGVPEEDLSHLAADAARGMRCGNFKLCMVRPDFRGHGLQQLLGLRLEEEARRKGMEALCATVAPMNGASRHSLERLGYRQAAVVEKYGFERLVFVKRLVVDLV